MGRERGWRRLFRLPGRSAGQVAADVDAELEFHLAERTRELMVRGLRTGEARREAEREFGDVAAARASLSEQGARHARRERRALGLDELRQDVRFGWRALVQRPGFTAVAVLTLALGIGANATMFGLVDGVLVRPLPFAAPERLVAVWPERAFSAAEYEAIATRNRSFAQVAAAFEGPGFALAGDGEPERVGGARVTANLFATLGVSAAVGRTLAAGESRPGQGRVVVIGEALWRRRWGGDPAIVGRAILVDGESHTVVGVMPAGFAYPSSAVQLWLPTTIDASNVATHWGFVGNRLVARLAPGVGPAQAHDDVLRIARQLRTENPLWTPQEPGYYEGAEIVGLRERLVGDVRLTLLVLLGAVAMVLLIACANVANLLLARGVARQRELAVRTALGAGRGRLVRQLLTESLLLAALGGVAGVALAWGGLRAMVALLPAAMPRLGEVALDGRVLLFALAATVGTGLVFGLVPALRVSRANASLMLGQRAYGGARRRLSAALVVSEMALAVVLVTGAGLLLRSFWLLTRVDPGFRTGQVTTALVSPPQAPFAEPARRRALYDAVLANARAIPGATAVAATSQLPFDQESEPTALMIRGVTRNRNELPTFDQRRVTPGYFQALGIRLLRGRAFTAADDETAPLVALVDEAAARQFWPGGDPVGATVGWWWSERWLQVVGVVSTTKNNSLATDGRPTLYVPFAQDPAASMRVVVRSTADPALVARELRRAVGAVDAGVPVSQLRTMDELLGASVARPRLTSLLIGGFAAVALLLGAIGLYGVIAYQVSQRTQEIGVRVALGARAGDVLALVFRQGLALALAGAALGLLASAALTRVLEHLLYGVSARDPLTYAVVPLLLVAVAALACLVPARRAMRVDPMTALRSE